MMRFAFAVVLAAVLGGGGWLVATRFDGDAGAALAALRSYTQTQVDDGTSAVPPKSSETPDGPSGRTGRGGRGGAGRVTAVVSAEAKQSDLPIVRAGVGWIEPIESVVVRARADGQIVEQRVEDGQMVKAGDVLFRLDDREAAAAIARDEATLARDRATLEKTQADLKRVEQLQSRNVAAQAQVDQVVADAKVAEANVAAAEAALRTNRIKLGYAIVSAPIEGRLGTVRVTPGNLVRGSDSSGDGLVTITQMKPLRVGFTLPERDLTLLRDSLGGKEPPQVKVFAGESPEPLATGGVTFIDSTVDTASGTISVKALLSNDDDRLWPGQYVRVEAQLGVRRDAVTIPVVAIQPGQDGSYAFVIGAENRVERRKVEIAESLGDLVAVASGVKPGERVVVEGQARLRNGSRVSEREPETAEDAAKSRADAEDRKSEGRRER